MGGRAGIQQFLWCWRCLHWSFQGFRHAQETLIAANNSIQSINHTGKNAILEGLLQGNPMTEVMTIGPACVHHLHQLPPFVVPFLHQFKKMHQSIVQPLGADDVLPQNGEGPEGIGHLPRLELVHLAARVVRQRRQEVFVVDVGLGKGHGTVG